MGLSVLQSILAGRLLGVAGFGVIGTITAFASTLNRLFSFRMNELVVKYFGGADTKGEHEKAQAVVKAAALGEFISALLSFGVILIFAPYAASNLADDPTTARLFMIYGTIVLANFATEASTGVLQVTNKFKTKPSLNLVSNVLTASIIVWAFFAKRGLAEVMMAYMLGKFVPAWAPRRSAGGKCRKIRGRLAQDALLPSAAAQGTLQFCLQHQYQQHHHYAGAR